MFGCNFLESCYFLMKDTKGVVLEGREGKKEMRGAEGEETIMRNTLYEERITFNKKRKKQNKKHKRKIICKHNSTENSKTIYKYEINLWSNKIIKGIIPQLDILCHQVKPSVADMGSILLSCQSKGPCGRP